MGLGAPLIALDRLKGKKERREAGGQGEEDRVSREGGRVRSAKKEVGRRACRLNSGREKAKGKNFREAASLLDRPRPRFN